MLKKACANYQLIYSLQNKWKIPSNKVIKEQTHNLYQNVESSDKPSYDQIFSLLVELFDYFFVLSKYILSAHCYQMCIKRMHNVDEIDRKIVYFKAKAQV